MAESEIIFPTSTYGRLGGIYGTVITQYNTAPNTSGFPNGSGLRLGQGGLLYDFSAVKLFNCSTTTPQYSAMTYSQSATAPYTNVAPASAANVPVIAISDRAGSTSMVQNNICWMTVKGVATSLVATSITAPAFLVSSTTAGQLGAAAAGTSIQGNIALLQTTTSATNWPIYIL